MAAARADVSARDHCIICGTNAAREGPHMASPEAPAEVVSRKMIARRFEPAAAER